MEHFDMKMNVSRQKLIAFVKYNTALDIISTPNICLPWLSKYINILNIYYVIYIVHIIY